MIQKIASTRVFIYTKNHFCYFDKHYKTRRFWIAIREINWRAKNFYHIKKKYFRSEAKIKKLDANRSENHQ